MQHPNPETVTLKDILITEELSRRASRTPNLQAENQAMRMLIHRMTHDAASLMQTLVDTALELCQAGTTGLSLLETTADGAEIFRAQALAGTLAHHVGGSTKRNFSPCGVCLDQGVPVLFSHPEHYFTYFQSANTPVVEGLVLPLVADNHVFGTIWIMSHDEQRQFDSEDVRIMTSLADFTATALLLQQRQTGELLAANAVLETEIVERKSLEAQTHALIANLPGGAVFVVDRDLRYLLAEGEALSAAGFKPKDFVGRTIFEVLPPDLAASYEPMYRQALAGEPFEHEHNAHHYTYLSRGTPLRSENGEVYAVLAVSYDITERKRAEAALRESEAKYRSLFQSIDAGFCVIEVLFDESGNAFDYRFLEANPAFEQQTGLVDAIGKTVRELVPQHEAHWFEIYGRIVRTGISERFENAAEELGRFYDVYAFGMGESREHKVAVLFNDISERKRQEEALRESEERLRDVLNSMAEGFALLGDDFTILDVNEETLRLDGRSRDELIGRSHWDAFPGTEDSPVGEIFRRVARERMSTSLEHVYCWPDGRSLWLDMRAYPTRNDGVAIFWRDVTDRKQAEAALRESEEKYRSLFETMDEGYLLSEVIFASNDKPIDIFYLEANPAAVRLAGRDFSGQRMREIDPNYEEYWYEIYGHVALTGESVRAERYAQPHDRWFDFYAFKVGGQESRRVAAVFNDITDRKHTEEQLRRAAEMDAFRVKLSDALRSLSDPIEIQRAAMHVIGEHLAVDRVFYANMMPDDVTTVIHDNYVRDGVRKFIGSFRTTDFGDAAERLRSGKTVVLTDVSTSEDYTEAEKAAYAGIGMNATLAVPLVKANRWVANLGIHSIEARCWTDEEVALVQETAERTWAAVERARAEAAVEADLKATQMLHNLATRLIGEEDRQALYQEIVKTAIALTQADAGSFQILDETTQELVIMATQGIDRTMAEHFYRLDASSNTSCGIALTTGERTFIHFDVPQSEDPDGSLRIHRDAGLRCVQSTPLRSRSGKPIGMVSTHWREDHQLSDRELRFLDLLARQAADIIEQRQAEENRIQLIHEQTAREQERQRAVREAARSADLAELDRAKTSFFSNISHEFRTPLTLSLAPLQDALSDRTHPLDPIHRERLELVHRNSLRLLKLVNTLLDFSRIEAGRMEAVYEPTDLATFTTELTSVFRSAIERAGLQLIVNCPPLPEPIFVDREMWEKIVLNLLSNAFKFTFEGEIRVSLYSTDRNQAILQVQDTGTGIAREHLPHLFERFYQVRGTKGRTHDGSGIGLALVNELVRLQGGTIEVSSTLGEGTCFTVSLLLGTDHLPSDRLHFEGDRYPVRTLASTAMAATAYVKAERWATTQNNQEQTIENTEEQTTQTADSSLPNHTSARVLVVDDNADMREYLTRILSEHVQVEVVADGVMALAAATEQVPDLILSDVMMPGLDGFKLLGALRASPRTREVPIILLSARAGVEAIVVGLEAGADDYLIKPFSAQELISRVTAHLQMAQLRQEALQEARSTIRSRDEFISIVSHELNTPLVSILGWTRLLRANSPSPTMLAKALDTIERNATLQAKLVQDLLDISRIAAGKLRLNTEPVELEAVIETAMATVTQMAQTKGIDFHWHKQNMANLDAHTANSIVVMGDRDRLGQVICNLLSNAIKFTPSSGSVTIELSVIDDDHSPNISCAQICVTDTGIGIAADFLPHVFERFRQARDSDAAKGMGLGLAIARHLVELHNGTISAQSAGVGQGATFTVKLPICLSQ
ncbi:ATP-binding protein [Scytonema sp. NUACC26]|uniref:ATP-binding protein n=1 Tax=Scytonema sp. NUACC26 TaxID=3140176 RepID=UPI0034DB83F8